MVRLPLVVHASVDVDVDVEGTASDARELTARVDVADELGATAAVALAVRNLVATAVVLPTARRLLGVRRVYASERVAVEVDEVIVAVAAVVVVAVRVASVRLRQACMTQQQQQRQQGMAGAKTKRCNVWMHHNCGGSGSGGGSYDIRRTYRKLILLVVHGAVVCRWILEVHRRARQRHHNVVLQRRARARCVVVAAVVDRIDGDVEGLRFVQPVAHPGFHHKLVAATVRRQTVRCRWARHDRRRRRCGGVDAFRERLEQGKRHCCVVAGKRLLCWNTSMQ